MFAVSDGGGKNSVMTTASESSAASGFYPQVILPLLHVHFLQQHVGQAGPPGHGIAITILRPGLRVHLPRERSRSASGIGVPTVTVIPIPILCLHNRIAC